MALNKSNTGTLARKPAVAPPTPNVAPSCIDFGPPRKVTLHRQAGSINNGLGFSIEVIKGESEKDSGVFVKKISATSPAAKGGQLRAGDKILEVNGQELSGVSQGSAANILWVAQNPVILLVQGPKMDTKPPPKVPPKPKMPKSNTTQTLPRARDTKKEYHGSTKSIDRKLIRKDKSSPVTEPTPPPPPSVTADEPPMVPVPEPMPVLSMKNNDRSIQRMDSNERVNSPNPEIIDRIVQEFNERIVVQQQQKLAAPQPMPPAPEFNDADDSGKLVINNELLPPSEPINLPHLTEFYDNVRGPLRTVQLDREAGKGLGVSIVVDKINGTQEKGVIIKNVVADSPAGRSGVVMPGDCIIQVNDRDLTGVTQPEVADLLRTVATPVTLIIQIGTQSEPDSNYDQSYGSDDEEEWTPPSVIQIERGSAKGLGISVVHNGFVTYSFETFPIENHQRT
ncbi:tyrosine-protein phosphatase non-receptor type 13-like [Tubulanus polymorphus]|uniref:tyrosine-protein phosphatase non-receptor type 13-like n=1 Tax=Tubulanus polymorphus TaxID=672921 RepID=UPI003DA3D8A8